MLNGRLAPPNEANCIYFIKNHKNKFDDSILEYKKLLGKGGFISDCAVKLFLNDDGTLGFDYAKHNRACQALVQRVSRVCHNSKKASISDFLGADERFFLEKIDNYYIRFGVYLVNESARDLQNFSLSEEFKFTIV